MAATHSHLYRDVAQHIRFEWEPGSKWVDIYAEGSEVPHTLGLTDFFRLHLDAAALIERIQSHQGGQIVSLFPAVTLLKGTPL